MIGIYPKYVWYICEYIWGMFELRYDSCYRILKNRVMIEMVNDEKDY